MASTSLTFQDMILALERYWADQGCTVMQPYDSEVGAGTFHTATTLRSLGPAAWRTCYVQPCRRPADGRYGDNPNRLQHYYYQMNGISMDSNEHLRLENVKILSTPGHAFVMHGTQHHTLFDHVDIVGCMNTFYEKYELLVKSIYLAVTVQ